MRKILKWADDLVLLPEPAKPSNETVLAILSKKLNRNDAEKLAKMLINYCLCLNVDIRHQTKRRRYALTFSLKNDICTLNDSAERLVKIRKLLEKAKTDKDEQIVFDNHSFILNIPSGTYIVPFLLSNSSNKIIYSLIPLHQPDQLGQLFLNWVFASPTELLQPPIQQITGYFGSEISLYFAWLAHYTKWLIAPALIGK
uniref:Anoctamin n=1 Tax=Meloidogyne hapla TaxID=6305 RepID=A0A1I8BTE5_MELHA